MKDKDNWTPLHSACRRGSKEVVQYLVEEQKCDVGELIQGIVNGVVCACIQ